MQINDANLQPAGNASTGAANRTGSAENAQSGSQARKAGTSGPSDAIELSSFAQQINDLQPESEAREAKVAELQELYQSGRYQVDTAALSAAIVEDALLLPRRKPWLRQRLYSNGTRFPGWTKLAAC